MALGSGCWVWVMAWPCLHEAMAMVTHPKIDRPPSLRAEALDQVDA